MLTSETAKGNLLRLRDNGYFHPPIFLIARLRLSLVFFALHLNMSWLRSVNKSHERSLQVGLFQSCESLVEMQTMLAERGESCAKNTF